MTNKTFTVAGTSELNGNTKIRFAQTTERTLTLEKNGHEQVLLIELPDAMTKTEAAQFLFTNKMFQDEAAQSAITTYVVNNAKDIAIAMGVAEVKATKAEKVTAEQAAEAEAQAKKDKKNARRRELRAAAKAEAA